MWLLRWLRRCGGGFQVVRGVHVCGLRHSSSSPVLVLVGVPSMWRSGGAHGDLRLYSVGFGLFCPLRVGGYSRLKVVVCAGPCWRARGLGTLRWAKALSWRLAGTDDGDACGRRILLEGVVEAGVSCSPLGFSGGNPRSLAGSSVGCALASLCLLGPRFGCPPDKGTCGVFWWFFGGGGFVFGQAGRGLGAGVVVGAVAPVFRLRLLR